MSTEEKARLITAIVRHLKFNAQKNKKEFCEGDTFFSLAFKSDSELLKIKKLIGI